MNTQPKGSLTGPFPPGRWSRWKQIESSIPFSRETYRIKAKLGKVPPPIRLSEKTTVYSNDELNLWFSNPVGYGK